MSAHIIPLAAGAVVLAGAAAIPNAAHPAGDRHAGVYQFVPVPQGWCAGHTPQAWRRETPARLIPLGELPAAYVIRLGASAPRAPTPEAKPAYDPCARVGPAVVRVR